MSNSKDAVRKILDAVKADKRTSLTAPEGKLVCDAYGIPVPKEGVAKSAADAARIATDMGFPVVMKIVSPDILHKTEAGGVMVGVKTDRKSTRLNSSHLYISYAVFCLKKNDIGRRHLADRHRGLPDRALDRDRQVLQEAGEVAGGRTTESGLVCFFFLIIGDPRDSTLFPYTTPSQ